MVLRRSKISWCDYSGGDLNFAIGCTPVSEGCKNCYAKAWAKRASRNFGNVRIYWDKLNRLCRAQWNPRDIPYRRGPESKPIMFPVDLGDLFHPDVPDHFIFSALSIIFPRTDADWVLLTKRPRRMLEMTSWWLESFQIDSLPTHIWCLVTVENQRWADERIPVLLQVKAQVLGVSLEPMLEPIDLCFPEPLTGNEHPYLGTDSVIDKLNWIIVGAESGPDRRPFDKDWAEDVYQQCRAAGVAFFYKQSSGLHPGTDPYLDGRIIQEFPPRPIP